MLSTQQSRSRCDWIPLAQKELERLAEDEVVKKRADIVSEILAVRAQLRSLNQLKPLLTLGDVAHPEDPRSPEAQSLEELSLIQKRVADTVRLIHLLERSFNNTRSSMETQEEEADLWRRERAGDALAREALCVRYLPLVKGLARSYARRFELPLDDLIQEGTIGLLNAIGKFDLDRGASFKTHARWWVRAAITVYIRDHSKTIRVSKYVRDRVMALNKAIRTFAARHGRPFKELEELAEFMGIGLEELKKLFHSKSILYRSTASMDAPETEHDERMLGAVLGGEDAQMAETIENLDRRWFWKTARERFFARVGNKPNNRRKWRVFERSLGLDPNYEFEGNPQLAQEMGITRERVRQLFHEVLDVIKKDQELRAALVLLTS